uniref:Uncharacterized protein n=1 Tax=Opuntia streptacantha TaxID=393608 RepID=A0A7C8ZMR3_OPUST
MSVSLQGILGHFSTFLSLIIHSLLLGSFVAITCIETTCPLTMLRPSTETEPAKFKFTGRCTCDMHTALVFLDWPLTLRAWLGISQYPIHVFRFCTVLQNPPRHSATINRPMGFFSTIPTETV